MNFSESLKKELDNQRKPSSLPPQDKSLDLREAIRDLRKPDKLLSVEPIEAELQDLVDVFSSWHKQSQAALIQRIREEAPSVDPARNSDTAYGERYMVQVFLELLTKLERELDE